MDKYDAPRFIADKSPVGFHVMIKPAGSACNLDCTYCFYLSKATLKGGPGSRSMSDETLEKFVRSYIRDVTADEVVFTWQGGEPTLRGLDFFRKAVALQKKHARPGQAVLNDLQTNGTLLDEEWCRFLKENDFLVGLSIDGPEHLHDAFRKAKNGAPTFQKVMRAARLLQRFEVPFNTLACVNSVNARYPLEVYRFLRDEVGSTHIQFTPVVEPRGFEHSAPPLEGGAGLPGIDDPRARPGHPDSIVTDWSVDAEDWGRFLCTVFDEWRAHDLGRVLVNQFETLVSQHLGCGPQMCVYSEFCGKAVAAEHDGRVYACDHLVYPEHEIGNIHESRLRDIVLYRSQVRFGYAKAEALPQRCLDCPYLADCRGECPKNRLLSTPEGEAGLNYLCRGLQAFFAHAAPEAERIAAGLRQPARQASS
ncbi:MAG: anaerobic sulfatase maturase [Xanthomonadales bacterium]|nr:anaerobic sulfatase maturase [Xanthomonadales bacterium]